MNTKVTKSLQPCFGTARLDPARQQLSKNRSLPRKYVQPALLGLGLLIGPHFAQAATITVSTLGEARLENGRCSLREALINANANNQSGSTDCVAGRGGDNIAFNVRGTVALKRALPVVSDPFSLAINGGDAITVSGNNKVSILRVNADAALILQNLKIVNGFAANFDDAGAIENNGTLAVFNCTFSGNRAGVRGGGIFNDGTLTVSGSAFLGNSAGGGGAIFNQFGGLAHVINSTFSGNTGFDGAGINNRGTITVSRSTFSGNRAREFGGGIVSASASGPLTIIDSTFSSNSAGTDGGAIGNYGQSTITNSTLFDNRARLAGGGILNSLEGVLVITNSTITGNRAGSGGGLFDGGHATLRSSIFARSTSGGDCASNGQAGTLNDGGYNIDTDGTCGFTQPTSQTTDPLLDPGGLKDNGGTTKTIALLQGSPAIDVIPINANGCETVISKDQRGTVRSGDVTHEGDGSCDVGAFEFAAPSGVRCAGLAVTIMGTGGIDNLAGTAGPDVIRGFAGNDVILGAGGNDVICGGTGNDTLTGGPGLDRLFGEGGKDRLTGSTGNDQLLAGPGADRLNGGAGRDRCDGGIGASDRATACEQRSNIP